MPWLLPWHQSYMKRKEWREEILNNKLKAYKPLLAATRMGVKFRPNGVALGSTPPTSTRTWTNSGSSSWQAFNRSVSPPNWACCWNVNKTGLRSVSKWLWEISDCKKYVEEKFFALDNYCKTLMKVRTQPAEITSIKPYLEYFSSMHLKAYFTNNNAVTPILPMYEKLPTEGLYHEEM